MSSMDCCTRKSNCNFTSPKGDGEKKTQRHQGRKDDG